MNKRGVSRTPCISLSKQPSGIKTGFPSLQQQKDRLRTFLDSQKKAFIIMPFHHDFDDVWLGGIQPACRESLYTAMRVDEVNLATLIQDDIYRCIDLADVVIADLTGNNANVMYELGLARGRGKKVIIICDGKHTKKIPFDVRGIRYIAYEYSWSGIEILKKRLKEFINILDEKL